MKRKMSLIAPILILLASSLGVTGCQYRYFANRDADFDDIFQIGGGITAENPKSGILPSSLGAHVQATEFLNLGAVCFNGHSAEWDGRGAFCGPESRMRIGFGPYQRIKIDQDYVAGCENYYKKYDTMWNDRMSSADRRWGNKAAKSLNYEYWAISSREGNPIMHRGWQYWENFNVEVGVCEPFLTHFGVNLRLGFDPSEISDFVLGFLCIDFKHDDLTPEEHAEMMGPQDVSKDMKPASD